MDALFKVCSTGTMLDWLDNQGFKSKRVERSSVNIINVRGDGNCLYHCLVALYKQTIQNSYGDGIALQERMHMNMHKFDVCDWHALFDPDTSKQFQTVEAGDVLRDLFCKYLHRHWEYYFNDMKFRDDLFDVANKYAFYKSRPRHDLTDGDSYSVRNDYILQMTTSQPKQWAGNVECDIASELFGVKIDLWTILPGDENVLHLNNKFIPSETNAEKNLDQVVWSLVHTNTNHYQYLSQQRHRSGDTLAASDQKPGCVLPRVAHPIDNKDSDASSIERMSDGRLVNTIFQSLPPTWQAIRSGAFENIENLVRNNGPLNIHAFTKWVWDTSFPTLPILKERVVTIALAIFLEVYQHVQMNAKSPNDTSPIIAPSHFHPGYLGPSNCGSSVVDDVFSKHARRASPRIS